MSKHILKTDPEVFDEVAAGRKTFEIRYNDRAYCAGDVLELRKTKHTGAEMKSGAPLEYVGEPITRTVSHVLYGPLYGLADGWVILSLAQPAQGEAVAWLFTCKKPGKMTVFATVDRDTTEHWPIDQWTSIDVQPLSAPPPATVPLAEHEKLCRDWDSLRNEFDRLSQEYVSLQSRLAKYESAEAVGIVNYCSPGQIIWQQEEDLPEGTKLIPKPDVEV